MAGAELNIGIGGDPSGIVNAFQAAGAAAGRFADVLKNTESQTRISFKSYADAVRTALSESSNRFVDFDQLAKQRAESIIDTNKRLTASVYNTLSNPRARPGATSQIGDLEKEVAQIARASAQVAKQRASDLAESIKIDVARKQGTNKAFSDSITAYLDHEKQLSKIVQNGAKERAKWAQANIPKDMAQGQSRLSLAAKDIGGGSQQAQYAQKLLDEIKVLVTTTKKDIPAAFTAAGESIVAAYGRGQTSTQKFASELQALRGVALKTFDDVGKAGAASQAMYAKNVFAHDAYIDQLKTKAAALALSNQQFAIQGRVQKVTVLAEELKAESDFFDKVKAMRKNDAEFQIKLDQEELARRQAFLKSMPKPTASSMVGSPMASLQTANTELAKGNGLVNLFNNGLTGTITKMGVYGLAAVKAFGMVKSAFDGIMKSYTKMGEAIYGLKLITNDTTEQVSELLYISNKFGVSSLSLQMRWAQAAKHLVDNNKWVKALAIEYKNLDGTTKPVINMLGEIGDKLNAMADSEKREAAAMAIFGRGYKDILPILVQGSAGMEKLRKEAAKYGMVWSDDDLRKEREFAMSKRELSAALQGLTNILAQKLAPVLSAIIRKLAELVGSFTRSWKASAGFRTGIKLLGLAMLIMISPMTALMVGLVYLVQHFEVVGDVIVAVSELLGTIVGKGVGVAAAAFKMLMDTVLEFAKGFLSVGEILTGNRFWKAVFGDGANESIKAARDSIDGFKIAMDKAVGGFAQSAWDNGGKWGKKFGEGAVSFIKKLKLPKTTMSDFNLGWGGGPEDPDQNAGGGGGGGKKNKLLEHFKQMVENARASLNALIEEAKNAKKQMDDTANSVRDALRGAFSVMELADETGGGRSGQGMIRLFQRRLDAMRGFVGNLSKLRDMGIPSDWLGEIVNAGVDKGAAVAKMLVSQPGVLAQLSDLRTQMNVETQVAGSMVGQAMFGDKIADAISRSTAYQGQFQTLLLQGKKFGYKPTAEDISVATQNIANSVYMNVGTNADPYAIEQAIAWALKTGVGGGGRRPGAGGNMIMPGMPGVAGSAWQPGRSSTEIINDLFGSNQQLQGPTS